jgi:hypothetical protein
MKIRKKNTPYDVDKSFWAHLSNLMLFSTGCLAGPAAADSIPLLLLLLLLSFRKYFRSPSNQAETGSSSKNPFLLPWRSKASLIPEEKPVLALHLFPRSPSLAVSQKRTRQS